MNERSVQVLISGSGEHQVRLHVQSGATAERSLAVQVASLHALTPTRPEFTPGAARVSGSSVPPSILLELRWSEPMAAAVPAEPRGEPAPLATAWATAQRRRRRR